ncbi:MAG: DNA-methyltransferase [Gemmatimonadaceae bacterium]
MATGKAGVTSKLNIWRRLRPILRASARDLRIVSPDCVSLLGDSRKILSALPKECVHTIITSPPYGDQKDYGSADELGWASRSHGEYLEDLRGILKEALRVSVSGGALWIVVDSFRRDKQTIPLPWQLVELAMSVGWTFHDTVVWDKGRSLPWSHAGHFRSVCEHILLLGKGNLREFDIESVRELDYLSSYWVRYPERYNPRGKAPGDLWHFPIPVQGSWSQQSLRHCCPFPPALVAKMLGLTTRRGDIVLDPFGGTGTVAAVASTMKRRGISIDINEAYHRDFASTGYALISNAAIGAANSIFKKRRDELTRTITNLRILKFPRTLYAQLSRADRLGPEAGTMITAFVIRAIETTPTGLPSAALDILATHREHVRAVENCAADVVKLPPLSKFGLIVTTRVLPPETWRTEYPPRGGDDRNRSWFLYPTGNFTRYTLRVPRKKLGHELRLLGQSAKVPPIFSSIGLRVDAGITD